MKYPHWLFACVLTGIIPEQVHAAEPVKFGTEIYGLSGYRIFDHRTSQYFSSPAVFGYGFNLFYRRLSIGFSRATTPGLANYIIVPLDQAYPIHYVQLEFLSSHLGVSVPLSRNMQLEASGGWNLTLVSKYNREHYISAGGAQGGLTLRYALGDLGRFAQCGISVHTAAIYTAFEQTRYPLGKWCYALDIGLYTRIGKLH